MQMQDGLLIGTNVLDLANQYRVAYMYLLLASEFLTREGAEARRDESGIRRERIRFLYLFILAGAVDAFLDFLPVPLEESKRDFEFLFPHHVPPQAAFIFREGEAFALVYRQKILPHLVDRNKQGPPARLSLFRRLPHIVIQARTPERGGFHDCQHVGSIQRRSNVGSP